MLDITQFSCSPLAQATTRTGKLGACAISPAGFHSPLTETKSGLTVTWRVTRSCNQSCLNCLYNPRRLADGAELSTNEGKALISDLADMPVTRLLFAGGEPLMRADLVELVAYAREHGIQPALLTNGALVSRPRASRWKQTCGGNVRVRAKEFFGDPWMSDPACYLTNEETSKAIVEQVETMEGDVLLIEQAA